MPHRWLELQSGPTLVALYWSLHAPSMSGLGIVLHQCSSVSSSAPETVNDADVLSLESFSSAPSTLSSAKALERWSEHLSSSPVLRNGTKGLKQQPEQSLLRLKCSVSSPSDPVPRDILVLPP